MQSELKPDFPTKDVHQAQIGAVRMEVKFSEVRIYFVFRGG
jgi:hypothetical protein